MAAVREKSGITSGDQRLLHKSKQLQETRDGIVMKFKDYGIGNNDTIVLALRVPGGILNERYV